MELIHTKFHPKAKIWKLIEWDSDVLKGRVTEKDLINGFKSHLPIECPQEFSKHKKCRAKIWDEDIYSREKIPFEKWPVICKVCKWTGHRLIAKME